MALLFRKTDRGRGPVYDMRVRRSHTTRPSNWRRVRFASRWPGGGLEITEDHLTGIRMADGTVVARQALAVGAPMVARAEVLVSLGVQPKPHPMGIGEFIPADAAGLTDVPGVWVAGNVTDLSATVIGAAAHV